MPDRGLAEGVVDRLPRRAQTIDNGTRSWRIRRGLKRTQAPALMITRPGG